MRAQIEIEELTYTYPGASAPILERFHLVVGQGELLLVAGKSGVGKSSLLRVFNGLVPHFHGGKLSGSVRVLGRDPVRLGPRVMSDWVGFVNQDPEAQFVASFVEDELAFAMENHGVKPDEMGRRIDEVLDRMSMVHLRRRRVESLSGGERQRVAVAGALALRPSVLVLDEPTSQLDPESAEQVLLSLDRLKAQGLTLIVSEHRLERIVGRADRVLLMSDEGPHRIGKPAKILSGSAMAPPLLQLASALNWERPPVTLEQARSHPRWPELEQQLAKLSLTGIESESPDGASESDPQNAVTVQALEYHYANQHGGMAALDGVEFSLPRGTWTALMGRNGSGKSTLMKCLMGILRPEIGQIRLHPNADLTLDPTQSQLSELCRWVGFVPQNPSRLLFHDTVDSEIEYGLKGDREREIWRRLSPSLGLDGFGFLHPRDLSTGERQRLAVATILIMGPRLLLLDEPTRGLDVSSKERFSDVLRALVDEGITVLTASHDVEWVARTADRAVILEAGRVIDSGSVREVLGGRHGRTRPEFEFVPQMVGLTGQARWLTPEALLASLSEHRP